LNITSVVVFGGVSLIDRLSLVGARRLAGNILVCKILGAAAARGLELEEVKKLGGVVRANLASVGLGWSTVMFQDGRTLLSGMRIHTTRR
jgi:dihydroxyacetone kinase